MDNAFIGTFSTIMGSAATLIFTTVLKKIGGLHFFITEFNCKISRKIEEEIDYIITYKIDIYNTSKENKIMRDFKLKLYNDDKILDERIPLDDDSEKNKDGLNQKYNADGKNIKPNCIITLKHSIKYSNYKKEMQQCNRVELTYKNVYNHDKKILIKSGNII